MTHSDIEPGEPACGTRSQLIYHTAG